MTDFYWELVLRDDTTVELAPQSVPVVQKRMANKDAINLKNRSIPYSEIKDFRQTDKPYGQPLLEAAAQAFNEPIWNPDGSMAVTWVKKSVSQKSYDKLYGGIPSYRKLDDDNGRAVVAFRVAIHDVDTTTTIPCNQDEINRLTSKQQ